MATPDLGDLCRSAVDDMVQSRNVRGRARWLLPAVDAGVLIGTLLAGLVVILSLVIAVTSSTIADLAVSLPPASVHDVLPPGVKLDDVTGVVEVDIGLGYRLAWWLTGPATAALVVAGLYLVHLMITTAQAGDPFVARNVTRIRALAGLHVVFYAVTVAHFLVARGIQHADGLDGVAFGPSLVPLYFAALLLVLAQIWQRGVELRDEQQLTV